MIKVRSTQQLDALQITREMITEQGQATIRKLVGDVTAAEVFPARVVVHTRKERYSFAVGQWFIRDRSGRIAILTDAEFQQNYELTE